MIKLSKSLACNKQDLILHFRSEADRELKLIQKTLPASKYKESAALMNQAVSNIKDTLISELLKQAQIEKWSNQEVLDCILMITYVQYVVMLEKRNAIWPYEYMTFSRRIGELWEPFCGIAFHYPIKKLTFINPPQFQDVKAILTKEINNFITGLKIDKQDKTQLDEYFNAVWGLVTSGEIKLGLDLHFEQDNKKTVIDFKSGFGSNEKGNTNRLLLVASIYKNLNDKHNCVILVRSREDSNNHYFQTLKHSGLWEAFCGDEAYEQIKKYTGFDLKNWVRTNVKWEEDFDSQTLKHLKQHKLEQYLIW